MTVTDNVVQSVCVLESAVVPGMGDFSLFFLLGIKMGEDLFVPVLSI